MTRPPSSSPGDVFASSAITGGITVQTGDDATSISELVNIPRDDHTTVSSISVLGDLSISEEQLRRFGCFGRALDLKMAQRGDEWSMGRIRIDRGESSLPSRTEWTPHPRPVRLLLSHRIDQVTE